MQRTDISRFRVNIDKDNYCEVDSFKLNDHRFCNIRSISGHIGDDFDKSALSDTIAKYLQYQNNVELINIISRELNRRNYFECYTRSDNTKYCSGNSNQNDEDIKQRILNDSEVCVYTHSLYSVKLQGSNNLFIPDKLKETCNYPIGIKCNSFSFYPIWYLNGKTNDPSCELICHFDIVIHLLAKVFVEFKAKILRLAATDIELAVHDSTTVEDYSKMRRDQLLLTLKQRDERIEKLIEMNKETNKKLDDLKADNNTTHRKLNTTNRKLNTTNRKLDITHRKLDKANEKLDDLKQSHREMRDAIVEYTTTLVKYSESKIPASNITTGTTHEVLVVFFRQETSDDIREAIEARNEISKKKIELAADEVIYDTVVVQDDKEDEELKKHNFDEDTDRIIFRGYCNNSMDLFKHFNANVGSIARVINMKQRCSRKIICKPRNEAKLHNKLQTYANRSLNIKQGLLSLMKFGTETMLSHIDKKLGEKVHTEVAELKEAIEKNTEAVNKNTEVMNAVLVMYNELHPDAKRVFFNHGYRDIIIENGKVMCKILKDSAKLHELTREEIKKLKFI